MRSAWLHRAVALLVAGALLLPSALPAAAQEPVAQGPLAALQVANNGGGVQIVWGGAALASASAAVAAGAADSAELLNALAAQMPLQRYQGFDLPFKVIPLRFAAMEAVTLPQITRLETIDLPAEMVNPGAPELPPVLLDEGQAAPVPVTAEIVALPEQPVFVLRQGWVKGEYLVMVAISPIFAQNGVTKLATALETNIPGAAAIAVAPWEYAEQRAAALEATDAQQAALATGAGEEDAEAAAAAASTVTLVVANPGMQSIKAAQLGSAYEVTGAMAKLRVSHRGVVVPVQVVVDEVRFYAESVGDRWNTNSYYQVSLENDPARRSPIMAARSLAAPGDGAAAVSTVIDRGEWQNSYGWPSRYSSKYPGADGDHYFSAIFNTKSLTDTVPSLTANLRDLARVLPRNELPLVNADATFTFTVTPDPSYSTGLDFVFDVAGRSDNVTLDATAGLTTATFSDAGNPVSMDVTFVPQATPRALFFESISYARPASLAMGGKGALFWGNPLDTGYRWSDAPQFAGGYGVWDVTDPDAPIALSGASAAGFQDSEAGRRYIVAGPGFAFEPAVRAYSPLTAASVPPAQRGVALYMIPDASFKAPLQPLLDLRNSQGTKALAVDVRRVYDAYSGGYVDPEAIRAFLMEAYATWPAASSPQDRVTPLSVVLVGDGTYDPRNFEQRERTPTLIPPYMIEGVDRWLGEVACDNCYGQFGDANTLFIMDVWVGRFPVKSTEEVQLVVSKIVSYETATDLKATWRSTALYLADNHLKPFLGSAQCATGCVDGGGDFAEFSDNAWVLNPNRTVPGLTPRVYFDPFPGTPKPPVFNEWWRVGLREDAQKRALWGLQDGPALVVYNGHANIFNMGELEKTGAARAFLLGLTDAFSLYRTNQLYVQLSMTCMTASFATPANSGTTIDEGFFLAPRGGAVAVWGSSGQSVAAGHELLQDGFFAKLFAKPGVAVRLGDLLEAGYMEFALAGPSNSDVLYNFLLLGDPLTKFNYRIDPRAANYVSPIYIPAVTK